MGRFWKTAAAGALALGLLVAGYLSLVLRHAGQKSEMASPAVCRIGFDVPEREAKVDRVGNVDMKILTRLDDKAPLSDVQERGE